MPKNIKKTLSAILIIALLISFSGCSFLPVGDEPNIDEPIVDEVTEPIPEEPADPNWPVTIGDETIKEAPERVVSLSPALSEYISDLGLLSKLSGCSDFCLPDENTLPRVGTATIIDFEELDKLSPKYVIIQGSPLEKDLLELQQRNITLLSFPTVSSENELFSLYDSLSLFFLGSLDYIDTANSAKEKYTNTLSEISSTVASYCESKGLSPKKGAVIRLMENTMMGSDCFEGELVKEIGLALPENVSSWLMPADGFSSLYADILFINPDLAIRDFESSANYKNLSAVYNDAIYRVDIDTLSVGGMRSLTVLRTMAVTLWPEAFPNEETLTPAYPSLYKQS